jgi:hypothetical protein
MPNLAANKLDEVLSKAYQVGLFFAGFISLTVLYDLPAQSRNPELVILGGLVLYGVIIFTSRSLYRRYLPYHQTNALWWYAIGLTAFILSFIINGNVHTLGLLTETGAGMMGVTVVYFSMMTIGMVALTKYLSGLSSKNKTGRWLIYALVPIALFIIGASVNPLNYISSYPFYRQVTGLIIGFIPIGWINELFVKSFRQWWRLEQ